MNNKVTIYTLAKELGMTPSMVSRALNPTGKVSAEKRTLVLEAAKKYNYIPNKLASRLSAKSIKIGVILHSKFKTLTKQTIKGFEKAFAELRDYKIEYTVKVIYDSEKKPQDCWDDFEEFAECDGVLISGFSSDECSEMLNDFYIKNQNLVQVQSVNNQIEYLFSSKHDERLASELAAEFLYNCVKFAERKNVLLFTGNRKSAVHKNSEKAFKNACDEFGMNLLEAVDMQDDEKILKDILPDVFEKYKDKVDCVYITSGNSIELCKYIKENNLKINLVTFDLYNEIEEYIKTGIVSATVYQNQELQAKVAFEKLVRYIIDGEKPPKDIFTDVQLVMRSNMKLIERN